MQTQTSSPPSVTSSDDGSLHKLDRLVSTEESHTYRLPPHVFVCQTQDCVVFLDARRDKYVGIGGDEGRALRTLLAASSSPEAHNGAVASISPQLSTTLLNTLVARGFLTLEPAPSKPFRSVSLEPGSCALGMGTEYETAPGLTHILSALIACTGARFNLRFRGVSGTVARLLAAKRRERNVDRPSTDELQRLISVFRVIRPFLYTKKNQCLLHGLTLHRFLRRYGFNPTWVIGVNIAPFGAHCWVQQNDCVLDDSPEHTLEFTPVVAI